MTFQIRLTDKNGYGSFLYLESSIKDKENLAEITANEYLHKERMKDESLFYNPFHQPYKPFRSVKVVEYDSINRGPKRGGIKFKLHLLSATWKFQSGEKITNRWYESD